MNQSPPQIGPEWTLEQLKLEYPGVEMALFANFGIGSRERSGFSAQERLDELLRRHLIFDTARACRRLNELAAEDRRYSVSASQLSKEPETVIVDARAAEEYERARLSGARLLSRETVSDLLGEPGVRVVTVCRDGSQAPAASRVLRSQGLDARHLRGGLEEWSRDVDRNYPVLYPLHEAGGFWYLLADDRTLRYRRVSPLSDRSARLVSRTELEEAGTWTSLLAALPDLETVISTPETFGVRGLPHRLEEAIAALPPELRDAPGWEDYGRPGDDRADRLKLEQVLQKEAPSILASHKGTVEVESYRHRVLTIRLGGQCAGCASAQITTQRELAACLYREVPLLDRITDRP